MLEAAIDRIPGEPLQSPSGIELRHLRAFLAVAQEMHFGRAAELLHTSKPAVSQQIAQLERAIGVPLFVRTSRRVRMTNVGEQVLADVRVIHDHVMAMTERVAGMRDGRTGLVRLGAPANLPPGFVRGALSDLSRAAPLVELELHSLSTSEQIDGLERGVIDLAIVRERARDPHIRHELLLTEPLGVALSQGSLLSRCPAIPVDRLDGQTLYWFGASQLPSLRGRLSELLRVNGVRLRSVREAPDLASALDLVAASYGISFVLEREVEAFRRSTDGVADITWRPLSNAHLGLTLWLAWPEGVAPSVACVRAALRREAARSPCGQRESAVT